MNVKTISLMIVGAFILVSAGLGYSYHLGYTSGVNSTYKTTSKAQTVAANKTVVSVTDTNAIDTAYQKGVQSAEVTHAANVATIHDYFIKLRNTKSKLMSNSGTNASGSASETYSGLSEEDYVNLNQIGFECNKIEEQSNNLVDLRNSDLKLVNSSEAK